MKGPIIPVFRHSIAPLLLFSDRRLIQLKGIVEGSDGQFRILGVDDAGNLDL